MIATANICPTPLKMPPRRYPCTKAAQLVASDRLYRGGDDHRREGQRHYSDLAIETALTLRAVFRLALRQSEGLIGSIMRLLEIDLPVSDHTTLSRRACGLPVASRRRLELKSFI